MIRADYRHGRCMVYILNLRVVVAISVNPLSLSNERLSGEGSISPANWATITGNVTRRCLLEDSVQRATNSDLCVCIDVLSIRIVIEISVDPLSVGYELERSQFSLAAAFHAATTRNVLSGRLLKWTMFRANDRHMRLRVHILNLRVVILITMNRCRFLDESFGGELAVPTTARTAIPREVV